MSNKIIMPNFPAAHLEPQHPTKEAAPPVKFERLIDKPIVKEMTCHIWMARSVAEKMFPVLKWEPDETHVVLTEVLRPALPHEKPDATHAVSGARFVVDHYELDGVPL